jgi:hypothetical protein
MFINFLIGLLVEFQVNASGVFVVKVVLYVPGVILFFLSIKTFQWVALYSSLFIMSPISMIISWLFDGIFGAKILRVHGARVTPTASIRLN